MFRAKQRLQDKAQSAENGPPLSRTATPDWSRCLAPCGRAGKRSPALLRLLARAGHYRRGAPGAQPLPDPLNMTISPGKSTRHWSLVVRMLQVTVLVGVIGIMGQDAATALNPPNIAGLEVRDPELIVPEYVELLRPDVDLIVLLTHQGKVGRDFGQALVDYFKSRNIVDVPVRGRLLPGS